MSKTKRKDWKFAICNLQSATWLFIAVLISGCGWDGHINILGYTTKPNYDCTIHTVYVPIFKNKTLYQHLEDDLTRVVIQEIEAKTPYKVVNSPHLADTELLGTIVNVNKSLILGNQLAEIREAQTMMTVEVLWRDLRAGHEGENLSHPRPAGRLGPPPPPGAPLVPAVIQTIGYLIPELGGSISTAKQEMVQKSAIQIVSMMEFWPAPPRPHPGP
jgi:hypothetical protein